MEKAILDNAMKQSDRWKNLKEDDLSDKEIRASFNQKEPMRSFCLEFQT
jgi:penicillin-binding protein 1A